ncbi:putative cytokinetic ring protein SteA [Armatimonas rosea]|uniref:Putative membrane-anchored protein n=1 Tax=Armatimonas rosea TaxID=685828 RepID=A0A7W9W8A9_ARMRO|nr:putative cytokinetic ring protein SteA [Armatimonas rosea]MBB6053344.1 putative membrane-anchored protein [Armatimonas rosea]
MTRGQWFTRGKEKAQSHTLEVRLGRRTKALAPTLSPGCLVVIDHPDLDAVAAQMLLRARPAAIINCQPFVTGRYPNRGPRVLLEAGIPLYELPGCDLFGVLKDGERLRLSDRRLADLELLTLPLLEDRLEAARKNLDAELQRFAQNTLQFLEKPEERALLLETGALPTLKTNLTGRHVLVVVRGEGYEQDLQRLTSYLREQKPAVIAVDGAADALLALGVRPELVLGDMDSVSDAALRCGAEIVVHAYADGRSPGKERVEALGVEVTLFPTAGTSEDAALLLAYEKGADLIVAVGTHSNLEDFLDKGRGGMASTFLVRLKVGSRLVDARGVSRLYGKHPSASPLLFFLSLSALFPVIVLAASTEWGKNAWQLINFWLRSLHR